MNDEGSIQGSSEWLKENNLALKDRVSCDTRSCPNDAECYCYIMCCKSVLISCGPCMEKALKELLVHAQTLQSVTCPACGKSCNPLGWISAPIKLNAEA